MSEHVLRCNDGGHYYANLDDSADQRQSGLAAWFGFHPDGRWANVFFGHVDERAGVRDHISGVWCDLPWGQAHGHGNMAVNIGNAPHHHWTVDSESGRFGGTEWSEASHSFPTPVHGVRDSSPEILEGVWQTDTGALYYMREMQPTVDHAPPGVYHVLVYWFAVRPDLSVAHVFKGDRMDSRVTGQWFDIPPGRTRYTGTLNLEIIAPGFLAKQSSTANFGSSRWIKLS